MSGNPSGELSLWLSAIHDMCSFLWWGGLLESRLRRSCTSVGTGSQMALLMDLAVFATSTRQVACATLLNPWAICTYSKGLAEVQYFWRTAHQSCKDHFIINQEPPWLWFTLPELGFPLLTDKYRRPIHPEIEEYMRWYVSNDQDRKKIDNEDC